MIDHLLGGYKVLLSFLFSLNELQAATQGFIHCDVRFTGGQREPHEHFFKYTNLQAMMPHP